MKKKSKRRRRRRPAPEVPEENPELEVPMTICGVSVFVLIASVIRALLRFRGGNDPNQTAGVAIFMNLFLIMVVIGAVFTIYYLQKAPRFIMGTPEFRPQWLNAQVIALCGCVVYTSVYYLLTVNSLEFKEDDSDSIWKLVALYMFFNCFGYVGMYLIAASSMPTRFFFKDYAGRKIYQFLNIKNKDYIAITCLLGGAGLILFSIAIPIIPYFVFTDSAR